MAYAAVLSLMQILQQIKDPDRCVRHEKQQIESLQEKVSFLHDFLENYSVCTDKVAKDLEIRIRDIAYRAEDIVESYVSSFILYGRNRRRRYRYITFCQACICDGGNSIGGFQNFCQDLDRVIEETHSIQQEVMNVKRMLDLNYVQQRNTLSVDRSRLTFTDRTPPMVGLVEDSTKIKDWLTSSSSKREVISIVGMGGIGKTTFARNLFDDALIVYHFHVRAWVTVSQDYEIHEILAGLLDSTNKLRPAMGELSGEELAERLYKSLKGRTYLIVMDDVWDTKVWDDVKRFFPDDDNGSRIVLTSRLTNVGDHAASFDHRHDMRSLNSDESWKLLCEKVFGGECCPPCLEGIGREIIRNCKGLPLSIVVVGGLLSMDKTVTYWETIAATLNSILAEDGGHCSTIFSLSYNHLPAHLKTCFLYLAIFPEDYDIRRSKLIKLWIAEGFIRPDESKNLEDKAEEYLEDLLNRSLIMVFKLGRDGKVKTYRIHDLLRDFCKTEVQKEKFLLVANRHTLSHPEDIRSERRVSIQPYTPFETREYFSNTNGPPLSTRSLLWYNQLHDIIISGRSLGLLRVLDTGAGFESSEFPMEIVKLVHLRYLSLRCFEVIVPASISSIWGLQTLVIDWWPRSDNLCCHLPLEVWKMPHLRHVQISNGCQLPDPPNKNFVILANLQTLSKMWNFRFTDEIIKRIPKLKKLKVFYDTEFEDWSHIHLSNMMCLNELETLKIRSGFKIPFQPNVNLPLALKKLIEIRSDFKIAFPPNFKFPAALKKLTFTGCRLLCWEDLTMLGSLPNLEVLILQNSACEGEEWEPNEGEFRELKFLGLYNLPLVHWRADSSHFPKLKCLNIEWCLKLKEIPMEIGEIPTLEMIELNDSNLNPSLVASAKLILEEQRDSGNDVLQLRIKDPLESRWTGKQVDSPIKRIRRVMTD